MTGENFEKEHWTIFFNKYTPNDDKKIVIAEKQFILFTEKILKKIPFWLWFVDEPVEEKVTVSVLVLDGRSRNIFKLFQKCS